MWTVLRAPSNPFYLAGFFGAVLIALLLGQFVPLALGGNRLLATAVFLIIVIPWIGVIIPYRWVLVLTLFWIVFEALPRRYIADDLLFFFIKDLFFGVLYFRALVSLRRTEERLDIDPRILVTLGLLVAWSGVQMFNPLLPSQLIGILGLRNWFWYIPLIFLVPLCFETKDSLIKFLRLYVLLGIPISLFGFIQSLVSSDHLINQTYIDFQAVFTTALGLKHRTIATFQSNGTFAFYLFFILLVGICLMHMSSNRIGRVGSVFLVISLVLAAAANAGTALPILAVVTVPVMLYIGADWRPSIGRALKRLTPILLLLAVVVAAAPTTVQEGWWRSIGPFITGDHAATGSENYVDRLKKHGGAVPYALSDTLIGHGIGSASHGRQYLLGSRQASAELAPIEGGFAKVAWELGIVGLVLFMAFELSIIMAMIRVRRRLRDPDLRWIALAGVLMHICLLSWLTIGPALDTSTTAILYWFLTGAVLGLERWDVPEQLASGISGGSK